MSLFRRSLLHTALLCALPALLLVAQKKPVTLSDAFMNRDLAGGGRGGGYTWLKNGTQYSITKRDSGAMSQSIYAVDAETGKEAKLVDLSGLKKPGKDSPFTFQSYSWSPDQTKLVFTLSVKRLWRRSTLGEYAVYDIASKKLTVLPKHGDGLRNVKVSPDGAWVGYVAADNIWVMNLASGEETQLTNDAQENVYNGRFGWVYEEEFSITDGWQWSPDSKRIAFWQEDERGVPEYKMTDWTSLHLEFVPIRYPKPGDANPIEKIGVIDVASRARTWMDLGSETDIYVPRIMWTQDPATLCIYRLNRLQNHLELLFADAATGKSRVVLEEKSATGWIDIENFGYLKFLTKKKQFIWNSERDGWNHAYLFNTDGTLVNQITKGAFEITQIAGLSPDEKVLYYVSTEVSPLERHLYSIRLDGGKKKKLSVEAGSHSFSMSPTCALYSDAWSSIDAPSKAVMRNIDGEELRVISEAKRETFAAYRWSQKELFTVKTADGLELQCSMLKPPDFDPAKKYPVYFDVYGGPGTQAVRNAWPGAMHQYIANEGFIVVQCDNRGSSGRGTDFKHRVYKQLGKWEANDYVETAKYLSALPFVDARNIVIWGWSYGGYMAALTMLLGADHFSAGVAVAPVTDWKFYDTIYAERFMQRPADNPDGYKAGSCLEHAKLLKGKLYLIHGGMDDNVHLQNMMQFVDRLHQANKNYELRIYPRGDHGVADGGTTMGLYESFMSFFRKVLVQ
ncbi:MAG: DPP IV N-terminal domain-containing protein [Ignavibacteriae bacterium]|nr:DPP IV N-terminal domain-containing protein [Ignavibacteriota bacterium]